MNWDELYSRVKKAAEKTADQINYSTDLAALQLKATLAEQKLEKAYTALGKTAYQHFAGEENTAEAVAKAMLRVENEKRAVALLKRRIAALKKQRAAETAEQKKAEENAKKELTPTESPITELKEAPVEPIITTESVEEIEVAKEQPEVPAEPLEESQVSPVEAEQEAQ